MTQPCSFFGRCGGCLYRDMPFADYLAMKKQKVVTALAHKAIDCPVADIIVIPEGTRRRATLAFGGGKLGFHAKGTHQIIDITSCPLLLPAMQALFAPLKKLTNSLGGKGSIALLMTDLGADIVLSYEIKKLSLDVVEKVTAFCQNNPVVRFMINNDIIYQRAQIAYESNPFMQPSQQGEAALRTLVLSELTDVKKALDLFCGLGTFTLPIQQAGIDVTGIDSAESAILALQKQHVKAVARDLFRQPVMVSELSGYDAVVLDPARAGAKTQCEQLAKSAVPTIVMVSCNPATFARDARALLNGGYRLQKLTPVEQFIFSDHIEVVGIFKK